MRYLLSLFLLLPVAAAAQTVENPYAHSAVPAPMQTCFAKLPALARRLHVGTAGASSLVAHGCDGNTYDVLALIGALLDRMDRAVPAAHTPLPKPRPIETPR